VKVHTEADRVSSRDSQIQARELSKSERLQQEEVRGVFVLGTIATIIALLQMHWLDFPIPATVAKADFFAQILLFFWGFYVFVMAIGVSGDVFPSGLADRAEAMGHFLFAGGILFSFMMLGFGFLTWLGRLQADQQIEAGYATVAMLLLAIVFWLKSDARSAEKFRGRVRSSLVRRSTRTRR
jgi:hypothetical protein